MISYTIFVFILVQSSFANLEDSYPETSDNYNLYTEEFIDPDEGDIDKRDNHFMRFGRDIGDYKNKEFTYDEYDDAGVPAKRSGNHHVRFGRSGPNAYMRFGRDHAKAGRNKSMFMRMGRNFQDQDDKIRSKRSAPQTSDPDYPKRKDHFMRFGKSSSFMRYGRNPEQALDSAILNQLLPINENYNGNQFKETHPLAVLLARLLARRQEFQKPCEVSA